MIPFGVAFAFVALPRLRRFPKDVLAAAVAFVFVFVLAFLQRSGGVGDLLKLGALLVFVVTAATMISGEEDYQLAVAALVIVGLYFAVMAFWRVDTFSHGVNPLEEVANKNAFSLYILPGLLLGGEIAVHAAPKRLVLRWGLMAALAVIAASPFLTANRSGWLGVVVTLVMLALFRLRLRASVFIVVLGAVGYAVISQYGTTAVAEARWEETVQGYSSDKLRWELFREAWKIGLENPILGVSPQYLPRELSSRVHVELPPVDPHNVVGYVVGGGGLTLFAMFLWLGWSIWRAPRRGLRDPCVVATHRALQMLVILWLVRGMFTREILYSPTFSIALGLAIGRREAALRVASPTPAVPEIVRSTQRAGIPARVDVRRAIEDGRSL